MPGDSGLEMSSIVDLSYLQAAHDVFSDSMRFQGIRVASAILDERATPLTFEFNHCDFCKAVRRTPAGAQKCRDSDLYGIGLAREAFQTTGRLAPTFYLCNQGLIDFCSPIVVQTDTEDQRDEIVAYFFGGQFRCACTWEDKQLRTPEKAEIDGLFAHQPLANEERLDANQLNTKFLDTPYITQDQFDKLRDAACNLANLLNGLVQKLYEWRRVERFKDFMDGVAKVRTVDQLFDLVIESLPKMIHARHCSIFTVQRDEPSGCERLVLRRTSYDSLRKGENCAYYEENEGLTGWVWKHARSLRLENLRNKSELMSYPGLKWEQKHNDSDDHKGFLCVPMLGRERKVIGVIRVPHKEPGNFDKYDEIFLNFLAGHVSSVMECQAGEERFDRVSGAEGLVDIAMELGKARSYRAVLDAALKGSLTLFGGEGKKHFVNIIEPDNKHWTVKCVGGTLGLSDEAKAGKGMTFGIMEGLTGLAIRDRKAVISSDLQASNRDGNYIRAVDGGESAMSAPMVWQEEVYGTISIVSNKKFEFSRENDLIILTRLAKLSAEAIREARRREARVKKARDRKIKGSRTWTSRFAGWIPRILDWLGKIFGGAS